MTTLDYIAQPSVRTTLDAIGAATNGSAIEALDVAAAYVTSGGVVDLTRRLRFLVPG